MVHNAGGIPHLSLLDAYEKIYRWYRGNTEIARHIAGSGYNWDERRKMILAVMNSKSIDKSHDILQTEFWEEQLSAEDVIALIQTLPNPSTATEAEVLFVCREVISGFLEWGYHGSDGVLKMHEYAESVIRDGTGEAVDFPQDLESRVKEVNHTLWSALETCRSRNCVFSNSNEAQRKMFEIYERRSDCL